MAKYPLSHNANKKLGEYFYDILNFHIPPTKNKIILDPTCGKKHLWVEYYKPDINGSNKISEYGEVIFSDKINYGQEVVSAIKDLNFNKQFDGIIYDPPYFFGYKNSNDPRRQDYGDYIQTYDDLLWFIVFANDKFPDWLKDDGKLILKCADQYQTKERKFYAHHITWVSKLSNFRLIDTFIFIHHRMSPTAFQVKNRPCSVIMHTYFLVFEKVKK
ncbi:hypothetical protein JW865_07735 [Candidatus Bathyarchaeota archaeon]|nr:hypothetical protein [Candidatus Bathyarchaeota archaeon]